MGINFAPLLAEVFLYLWEAECIKFLLSAGTEQISFQFNVTYRYIDKELSIDNIDFDKYLGQMNPAELEIKKTTLWFLLGFTTVDRGRPAAHFILRQLGDFNFHIPNFPFLSCHIPSSPAYAIFISNLSLYVRAY